MSRFVYHLPEEGNSVGINGKLFWQILTKKAVFSTSIHENLMQSRSSLPKLFFDRSLFHSSTF